MISKPDLQKGTRLMTHLKRRPGGAVALAAGLATMSLGLQSFAAEPAHISSDITTAAGANGQLMIGEAPRSDLGLSIPDYDIRIGGHVNAGWSYNFDPFTHDFARD